MFFDFAELKDKKEIDFVVFNKNVYENVYKETEIIFFDFAELKVEKDSFFTSKINEKLNFDKETEVSFEVAKTFF